MSQSATLLVIDDEPQIRKFLRISLASQGYKVIEAATGAEGLAQAALSKPDRWCSTLAYPTWTANRCCASCVNGAPCQCWCSRCARVKYRKSTHSMAAPTTT